jgi:glucokinase
MSAALALDIGASRVRAARVAPDGILGTILDHPVPTRDDTDVLTRDLQLTLRDLEPAPPSDSAIGVAFPAFLDERGRVAWCLNLPALEGVDLQAALAPAAHGLPTRLVTDLVAAAIAESTLGSGRGSARFLCLSVGSGVNAAMVVDGTPLETALGSLGDAGHISVDPDGPECACGGRGCLEAVASGLALARDGAAIGFASAEAVCAAARSGNQRARELVERAGVFLGRAVAAWSALLWPDRVAVAGGLSAAFDLLERPLRSELVRVGASYIVDRIEVVPAVLGWRAGVVGAGLMALRATERENQ